MPIDLLQNTSDPTIDLFQDALRAYQEDHPAARIALYRQNPMSVRVRIIDPELAPLDRVERSQIVWNYLKKLPDDAQSDLSMLLLLAPDETKTSLANLEFEDPSPPLGP